MNISGIRPSEGFYSYNSIRVNELRNSQIMSSKQAVDDTASQQSIADDTADYEDARARQSFTSLDYAKTYDSNASYELKGADSDISTLDVAKAVSDLDKDKVLQQYQHLVTGVSQTDFSGYPDCRDAFIKSLNVTLNLAMDEQFVIHTPLMWIDKAETWALADELGVLELIRTETLTCYNGVQGDGCGHCPACTLRREGLEKYLKSKNQ